jgi:glycosyltransferase involved in cell wall biosynthesis
LPESADEDMASPATPPLVSIVTPTYNQAEFLAETIDSMLAQDYPNIEYLVLDDGSTDATPDVLHRYDGRVRWERQANVGQSRTLNQGWARSHGEYIGYLSSDDLLLPHALSTLVEALEAHPQATVAYCDFDLIDASGVKVGVATSPDFDHRRMLEQLICPPGPGALFRRSVFDQTGGWNERLRKIPDFEFWLRAAQFGPFVRVPQVLAQYRVHNESGSIRPIPIDRSMEIVNTMREYWSGDSSPSARLSLASAHLKAAKSHAQSGRVLYALHQFWAAARCRPKTLVSISSWGKLLSGFGLLLTSRCGQLSARLR